MYISHKEHPLYIEYIEKKRIIEIKYNSLLSYKYDRSPGDGQRLIDLLDKEYFSKIEKLQEELFE